MYLLSYLAKLIQKPHIICFTLQHELHNLVSFDLENKREATEHTSHKGEWLRVWTWLVIKLQINAWRIDLTKNRGYVGFEVFPFNLMMCEMHIQKKNMLMLFVVYSVWLHLTALKHQLHCTYIVWFQESKFLCIPAHWITLLAWVAWQAADSLQSLWYLGQHKLHLLLHFLYK